MNRSLQIWKYLSLSLFLCTIFFLTYIYITTYQTLRAYRQELAQTNALAQDEKTASLLIQAQNKFKEIKKIQNSIKRKPSTALRKPADYLHILAKTIPASAKIIKLIITDAGGEIHGATHDQQTIPIFLRALAEHFTTVLLQKAHQTKVPETEFTITVS
jgi:hypothetical protein